KYPKSKIESGVRFEILRATLKAHPDDRKSVMSAVKAILTATPRKYHLYSYGSIATAMVEANAFSTEAEKYARKSLAAYKQDQYYAEQRKFAAEAKRQPPSDAELSQSYNRSRSGPMLSLGLLAVKAGRADEGRQMLTEVVRYQPMSAEANAGLAQLAEKDGDETKALDYLLIAKLSGRIPEAALGDLKRLYTKKHGSLDTLEATLDEMYST